MPAAPLAKGLIVATTILIAASISLYENEQVREWIDLQRRKLTAALHQYGADAGDPNAVGAVGTVRAVDREGKMDIEDEKETEEQRRKREAVVRKNLYLNGVEGVRERGKKTGSASFADFLDGQGRLRDGSEQENNEASKLSATSTLPALGQDLSSSSEVGASPSSPQPASTSSGVQAIFSPTNAEASPSIPPPILAAFASQDLSEPYSPQPQLPIVPSIRNPEAESAPSTPTLAALTPTSTASFLSPFNSSFPSPTVNQAPLHANPLGRLESDPWDSLASQASSTEALERDRGFDDVVRTGETAVEEVESECGSAADWVSDRGVSTPGDWSEVGSVVSGEEVQMVRH
ncbi:MAG: hypothetical protein M1814_001021 [Vezdaea aestivalis]|nr:MAG: hypothetical protein M1814_001021 [Vezdaea aestivalis]